MDRAETRALNRAIREAREEGLNYDELDEEEQRQRFNKAYDAWMIEHGLDPLVDD